MRTITVFETTEEIFDGFDDGTLDRGKIYLVLEGWSDPVRFSGQDCGRFSISSDVTQDILVKAFAEKLGVPIYLT